MTRAARTDHRPAPPTRSPAGSPTASPTGRRAAAGGFTLVEMLVSFTILIIILVALLALFDLNSKLARAQTHVADMQQSLRITQHTLLRDVRMAGRGGLPRGIIDDAGGGLAVAVNDNVADGTTIAAGGPRVLPGTDVLTIRGVITTPIYQVEPAGAVTFDDPNNPTSGSIRLSNPHPTTGVTQEFQPLLDTLGDEGRPEALILVSPLDDAIYAVVEISGVTPPGEGDNPQILTLDFTVTGGTHTADYLALSPGGAFPPQLTNAVAFAGLLEEYRFYIREEFEVPGDDTSDLAPVFSRARLFPGTEEAIAAQDDIAENILDLQVAFAIDTDGDEQVPDAGDAADDWLFNFADDDVTEERWNGPGLPPPRLYYVRVSTLARTDKRDFGYVAPPIVAIENRQYGETDPPGSDANRQDRMYRRRQLETIVDLRNVS